MKGLPIITNVILATVLLTSPFALIPPSPIFAAECTPAPSEMVSWWTGEGDSADLLGNNNGNEFGDTSFAVGKVGQAFSFDGDGDYVLIDNESNFDFTDSEFAIDGWFKTDDISFRQMIITKAGATSGYSWQVELQNGKLVTGMFDAVGNDVIVRESSNALNDGQWHFFAVNFDYPSESATLYIDGVLDNNLRTDGTAFNDPVISNEPVLIGARDFSSPQHFFNGMIDELEIFERNLTSDEILAIYQADSAGKCQNEDPVCLNASPNSATLWPPNHQMAPITIVGVTDPDGDPINIIVDSVLQDEPTNTNGDGDQSPDATLSPLQIRSERSGNNDGRVYEISFTADDGNGGTCDGSVFVGVPHDKKDTPVNSGTIYDSTS
ncbi:MAG: LamG domain-containing protein [Nitrosopumilus sp.]|nr:LamG domain-containing protein [Nitrosopumilus sp.]